MYDSYHALYLFIYLIINILKIPKADFIVERQYFKLKPINIVFKKDQTNTVHFKNVNRSNTKNAFNGVKHNNLFPVKTSLMQPVTEGNFA